MTSVQTGPVLWRSPLVGIEAVEARIRVTGGLGVISRRPNALPRNSRGAPVGSEVHQQVVANVLLRSTPLGYPRL